MHAGVSLRTAIIEGVWVAKDSRENAEHITVKTWVVIGYNKSKAKQMTLEHNCLLSLLLSLMHTNQIMYMR